MIIKKEKNEHIVYNLADHMVTASSCPPWSPTLYLLGVGPPSTVLLACPQVKTPVPCVSQSKTSLWHCPHTKL